MNRSVSRRDIFRRSAGAFLVVSLASGAAILAGLTGGGGAAYAVTRNRAAEQFVEQNATNALRALADRSMDESHVRQTFGNLMVQFADIPRISRFVLGAHAARLRQDPRLASDWGEAFRAFTVANYADRLRSYAGRAVHATGSVERIPDQDVIVRTEIARDAPQSPRIVQWRMLRAGATWKVADIAVVLDGNEVWLAQQQKSQFTSILDRNNGDMRGLIDNVRQTTAALDAHARGAP